MEHLLSQYNNSIINVTSLKKEVKAKLKQHEAKLKEAKKPTHEEQEDGWIKVNHKGGRDHTKKTKNKKKKKEEKLINFYKFELQEAKLKKHQLLLEKFEEDKKRIAKMKEQRKFKI